MTNPDELPDRVLLAKVYAARDGDEVVCFAKAAKWLSLHGDDMVAVMLSNGADALDVLAQSFGDVPDGEPAPVFSIVPPKPSGRGEGAQADSPTDGDDDDAA